MNIQTTLFFIAAFLATLWIFDNPSVAAGMLIAWPGVMVLTAIQEK